MHVSNRDVAIMKTLSFIDLALPEGLRKAVADLGFEEPTPIQSLSIPVIREGRDMIGQAHTGTGKTAAYGLPLLEGIDPQRKGVQVVVLCPTRELAIQVSEELLKLGKHMKGIVIIPVYGGQPIERQLAALRKGVQVVIGTPGRMLDHLDRRSLDISSVRMVVLDEADEMLNMGFRDDIEAILRKTPGTRQTVMFSATMPREIIDLSQKYLKKPQLIQVVHEQLTVPSVEQRYFEVKESMKVEALCRLIDTYNPQLSLVFCNTKRRVDELTSHLQARGYLAEAIHGDLTQGQRERVMGKFRAGTIDILVATDVAARGIDVEDIDAVFNFDVPQDPEYYVHRIGRTGRAGKGGRSFTLVSGKDIWKLREIQRYAKIRIAPDTIPTEQDQRQRRAGILIERVRTQIEKGGLEPCTMLLQQLVGEEYTSLDIAAALLRLSLAQGRSSEGGAEITPVPEQKPGAGRGQRPGTQGRGRRPPGRGRYSS